MINRFAASLAAMAVLAWPLPAMAGEDVSDAVDQALWCGAAYAALTQIDGMSEDDIASADARATATFVVAVDAMSQDGIAETDYDRLIDMSRSPSKTSPIPRPSCAIATPNAKPWSTRQADIRH